MSILFFILFFGSLFVWKALKKKQVSRVDEIVTEPAFDFLKEESNDCPYCGKNIEPKPKRKKKCPSCGQYIYMKYGFLLSEEQKKKFDTKIGFLSKLPNMPGWLPFD